MADTKVCELKDVALELIRKNKTTRINIVTADKKLCLSYERTSMMNYLSYGVTDRYIVAYFTDLHEHCKVRVTGLYDRVEKRMVQVTKENREFIKNTLVSKQSFHLSVVLEYLNYCKIDAATEEEAQALEDYLTSKREIPREEIEAWIFKSYPMLRKYTGQTKTLKVERYLAVLQEVEGEDLYFYAMPITF